MLQKIFLSSLTYNKTSGDQTLHKPFKSSSSSRTTMVMTDNRPSINTWQSNKLAWNFFKKLSPGQQLLERLVLEHPMASHPADPGKARLRLRRPRRRLPRHRPLLRRLPLRRLPGRRRRPRRRLRAMAGGGGRRGLRRGLLPGSAAPRGGGGGRRRGGKGGQRSSQGLTSDSRFVFFFRPW